MSKLPTNVTSDAHKLVRIKEKCKFMQLRRTLVKPIFAVFSVLVAILGFAVTASAQTATITYTYDDLNRVTNVSYQGGITQTFTPNDAGNITASSVTTASVDVRGVNATAYAFFGTTTSSCNCGIPDAWAYTYGLDWYDPNLANESPENDGVTNWDAYSWDENPWNPNDQPPASPVPAISATGLLVTALILICLACLTQRRRHPSV